MKTQGISNIFKYSAKFSSKLINNTFQLRRTLSYYTTTLLHLIKFIPKNFLVKTKMKKHISELLLLFWRSEIGNREHFEMRSVQRSQVKSSSRYSGPEACRGGGRKGNGSIGGSSRNSGKGIILRVSEERVSNYQRIALHSVRRAWLAPSKSNSFRTLGTDPPVLLASFPTNAALSLCFPVLLPCQPLPPSVSSVHNSPVRCSRIIFSLDSILRSFSTSYSSYHILFIFCCLHSFSLFITFSLFFVVSPIFLCLLLRSSPLLSPSASFTQFSTFSAFYSAFSPFLSLSLSFCVFLFFLCALLCPASFLCLYLFYLSVSFCIFLSLLYVSLYPFLSFCVSFVFFAAPFCLFLSLFCIYVFLSFSLSGTSVGFPLLAPSISFGLGQIFRILRGRNAKSTDLRSACTF